MVDDSVTSKGELRSAGETAMPILPSEAQPRSIRSDELFAGQKMVLIQHAGEQYRLLITRNDRLILQK